MARDPDSHTATSTPASLGERRPLPRLWKVVRAHPVLVVFLLALVVRLVAATAMDIFLDRSLLLDDVGYIEFAAEAASGEDSKWEPSRHVQYSRNGVFLVPLTFLFKIFGPVPLIGQWLVALVGAAVAALTTRLAMELVERQWAVASGLMVGLLPSQVFFTSVTMKDAFVWAASAVIAVGLATAARQGTRWRLACWLIPCAVSLIALTRLRAHTGIVAAWALAMAAWFGHRSLAGSRTAAAILLAVAMPWIGGLGPGGVTFLRSLSSVEDYRQAQADGNTPIIPPTTQPPVALPADPGEAVSPEGVDDSGRSDPSATAPVTVEPEQVPAADEAFYPDQLAPAAEVEGAGRYLTHLPVGLAVMLFEPHPFRRAHNPQMWLAKAEMVLWYPLLALAVVGLSRLLRVAGQSGRAAAFPVLVGAGSLFVAALAEGNFGTAFRHRGEFVWVVALLATVGLRSLWLRRHRLAAPAGVTNVVTLR